MKQTLKGMLVLSLALSAVYAVPAAAQDAAKHSAAITDVDKAVIGTWEGKYTSDHAPSGAMRLTIARDSALKVTSLEMAMGHGMEAMPVRKFTASTSDISWVQETMDQACQTTAVLRDGQMKGAIVCGHAAANFVLTKQSK